MAKRRPADSVFSFITVSSLFFLGLIAVDAAHGNEVTEESTLQCKPLFSDENRSEQHSSYSHPPLIIVKPPEWIRSSSLDAISRDTFGTFPHNPESVYIDSDDLKISPENYELIYLEGGKLYRHFDKIDPKTGEIQTHRWEFPVQRGVATFEAMEEQLRSGDMYKKLMIAMYPHKLPPTPGIKKKHSVERDYSRPAYEIRFNSEVDRVIAKCADSERIVKDTVTREILLDENGHPMQSKDTWISPEVQATWLKMVERKTAYTVGVFTTEHHPYEIQNNTQGGHLAAGAVGVVIGGVVTGLTLFMDKDRGMLEGKDNKVLYDNAGKLAYLAEADFFESEGLEFMDSVAVNAVPESFGARFYPRSEFHKLIKESQQRGYVLSLPKDFTWNIRRDRWSKEFLLEKAKNAKASAAH